MLLLTNSAIRAHNMPSVRPVVSEISFEDNQKMNNIEWRKVSKKDRTKNKKQNWKLQPL